MAAPEADDAHAPGIQRKIPLADRAAAAFNLLAGCGETLGLAVSGGSDSLALLHLASVWTRQSGRRLSVATVNHGLRPEAAAEAEEVARICATLGASHSTLQWRPAGSHISQNDARHARHRLLADWARDNSLTTLAIGHTQDDRIETFMIRARAGSGWWGLASPMPASASPADARLRLVRPLLALARADLRNYLDSHGARWIDDPSNTATRFERVRMRALVARLDPAARAACLRNIDRLALMRAAVMREARQALDHSGAITACGLELERDALGALSKTGRLRLLEAAVIAAGGGRLPPPLAPLEKLAAAIGADAATSAINVGAALLKSSGGKSAPRILIAPEPPRRGSTAGSSGRSGPDWDRLTALLADPGLEALAV